MADNLKNVFNRIAPGWYGFRHCSIFTRELNRLAERWHSGSLLNLGCAHGPDFLPFRNNFRLYGVDFSEEMLKLARKYALKHDFKVELTLADVRQLPYPSEHFDWTISVATYHHIKSKHGRLEALSELWRILKPSGEAFITVWNRWQPRFLLKPKDLYVPWRSRANTFYRYYHLFSYTELEKLAVKAGFSILDSHPESAYRFPLKRFSRNICLLLKKSG